MLHVDEAGSVCSDENIGNVDVNVDVNVIGHRIQALDRSNRERSLRVATWNFSGLCSECKQKEIGEVLAKINIDVVVGKESWEKEDSSVNVEGCKQMVWEAYH